MKTITRTCLNPKCQKQFEAKPREVNRGGGKYCSISCSTRHTASLRILEMTYLECAHCHNQFSRQASRHRKAPSKTGLYYCSRKCKDLAHREDCHHARTLAFRNYEHKCNRCGWDKVSAVLEVHHKDRNRKHNELTNLELLCPTDHSLEHFLAQDGKWSK
jgi:hypothetical protein